MANWRMTNNTHTAMILNTQAKGPSGWRSPAKALSRARGDGTRWILDSKTRADFLEQD